MASLANLKELRALQGKLVAELERSLAIQQLWPDAFAHGRCTSRWIGAPLDRNRRDGRIRYALRLRISDGAGNAREFPQADVPVILWPAPERGRLP